MLRSHNAFPLLVLLLATPAPAEPPSWLLPKADYTAETVMQAQDGVMSGRIWASGEKERRELTVKGRRHVMILRKDRGVTWVLMPEQRMYLETSATDGAPTAHRFEGGQIVREALGRESVNGAAATRYRVHGTAADGEKFEGTMWMTDQEIPVRVVSGTGRERVHMELRNLSVGRVSPDRFEVPAGYTRFELPAPAKADLEGLRERYGP